MLIDIKTNRELWYSFNIWAYCYNEQQTRNKNRKVGWEKKQKKQIRRQIDTKIVLCYRRRIVWCNKQKIKWTDRSVQGVHGKNTMQTLQENTKILKSFEIIF